MIEPDPTEPTQASRMASSRACDWLARVLEADGLHCAALVIDAALAAERERCAKVADEVTAFWKSRDFTWKYGVSDEVARRIRSLPADGDKR